MFLWHHLRSETRPILIYGMGNGAQKLMELCEAYEIPISALFVSDSHAREGRFQGYPLLSRTHAAETYPEAVVLLAFGTDRPEEIREILAMPEDWTLRIPDIPLMGGTILTEHTIAERQQELETARDLLCDEHSKALFDSLLAYKLSGDPTQLMANTTPRSSLLSMLQLGPEENYLDLGAYRGDTIEEFLTLTNGVYRSITALEPDAHNFKKLQEAYPNLPNLLCLPYAAWNQEAQLKFTGKGGRNCCVLPEISGQYRHIRQVGAIALDSLGRDFSYIKMDVEGAEAQALSGLAKTIARCRPKMLVSAYHRPDDFWTLLLLIHRLNPAYCLYLRREPCLPAWEIQIAAL